MSIDYQIFFERSDDGVSDLFRLGAVSGVKVHAPSQVEIEGLAYVQSIHLNGHSRSVMQNDYGDYGLTYDWEICGTQDSECDLVALIRRLFLCTAQLINVRPTRNVALLCDGRTFYVFNSRERLVLIPHFVDLIPDSPFFFERPCEILEINQWKN